MVQLGWRNHSSRKADAGAEIVTGEMGMLRKQVPTLHLPAMLAAKGEEAERGWARAAVSLTGGLMI
jgi:hypothetical protein